MRSPCPPADEGRVTPVIGPPPTSTDSSGVVVPPQLSTHRSLVPHLCLGQLLNSRPGLQLIIIALIPAFTVLVFGLLFRSMLLAMFFMHAGMILFPLAFILSKSDCTNSIHSLCLTPLHWYHHYYQSEMARSVSGYATLLLSIISFFVTTLCGSLIYLMLQCSGRWWQILCIGSYESQLDIFGLGSLRGDAAHLFIDVLLALYFIIVNPIIEEFFWRIFLIKELSDVSRNGPLMGRSLPAFLPVPTIDEEEEDDGDEIPSPTAYPVEGIVDIEVGNGIDVFMDEEIARSAPSMVASISPTPSVELLKSSSESINWIGSALYGSYHILVVWALLNSFPYAILAFVILVLVGRLLIWIIQSEQGPTATISGFCLATAVGRVPGIMVSYCSFSGTQWP